MHEEPFHGIDVHITLEGDKVSFTPGEEVCGTVYVDSREEFNSTAMMLCLEGVEELETDKDRSKKLSEYYMAGENVLLNKKFKFEDYDSF